MLISNEYASRTRMTAERRSATARAVSERGNAYILPIRIDDVDIDDLPSDAQLPVWKGALRVADRRDPDREAARLTRGCLTQGSFRPRPRAASCRSPIIGQESGARAIRASLRVRNSCVGSEPTGVLRSPPAISPKQRVERLLPPWQPDEARRADLPRAIARTRPRRARLPSLRKSLACGHEVLPWT